ncbi:hypothetical protein RKD18_006459 [Streptomyces phaeoluteigriseus]
MTTTRPPLPDFAGFATLDREVSPTGCRSGAPSPSG